LRRDRRLKEHSMLKPASLALIGIVASVSVAGAARPSTLGMSCAQAAATVAASGAIVLSTGEFTYDRFVAHTGFCLHDEAARPAVAPTLDSPYCSIGYRCEQKRRRFDF
jgi:hypothetical protein